jgi:hypothetical protein
MLKLWPGILVFLVCGLACGYGQWRRVHGSPVKARETVWIVLVIFAVSFPALTLPMVLSASAMTLRDQIETVIAALVIGTLPLAVGLCLWRSLKIVRLYVAYARSASRRDSL